MEQVYKEQFEEQIYLTIDELMPTWSAYLDLLIYDYETAESFRAENNLFFLFANRCCVGESWKWKDNYATNHSPSFCKICDGFAFGKEDIIGVTGFSDIIGGVRLGSIGKNWRETPTIKKFVEHFNATHV